MARLGRGRPQRGFLPAPVVSGGGPTNVNAADTGTGADTASNTSAALTAADTGSGVDSASAPVVAVAAADTGTGVDSAGSPAVALTAADTRPAATDTASAPAVALTAADTGTGADTAASPAVALSVADTGAGVDNATVQQGTTNVNASDTGTGADSAAAPAVALTAADTGAGVDSAASPAVSLTAGDTGSGANAATLAAALTATDTGSGVDAVLRVGITATDTGTGVDSAAAPVVALTATDTGTGTDTVVNSARTATDTGSGADSASLATALTATDTGSGADSAFTSRTATDTGTFADSASVNILYSRSDNMEQTNNTTLTTGNSLFDLLVGTGSGTFKTSPTAAEGNSSLEWASTGTGYRGKDTATLPGATNGGTAKTVLYSRVYMRNTGAPSAADRIFVFESSVGTGGTDIAGIRLQTNNTVRLGDAGVYPATGSTRAMSSTEWTRYEWKIDQDNNTQELRMWWGADLHNPSTGATNYESLTAALNDNTAIEVWGIGNFAGVTHTLYVDALAISSVNWIGPATGSTPIDATDAGTFTDSAAAPAVALTATDTGTGANATTLATALTAADTGAGADTIVNSARTATDTGAGTDTSTLAAAVTATDTGTGVESAFTSRTATDTGTGADTATLAAALTAADTGTGVDAASVNQGGAVSATDTGSGADNATLAAALTASDTATGVDSASVATTTNIFASDTGVFSDTTSTFTDNLEAGTGTGWTGGGDWQGVGNGSTYSYRSRFTSPVYRTVTPADSGTLQADFKFDSAGHEGEPLVAWDSGGTKLVVASVLPNQDKVRLYIGTNILATSATLGLTYTNWHTWQMQFYIHDTLGWAKIWVDGNLVIDFSGDTRSGAATYARVGWAVDPGNWIEYQNLDNYSYTGPSAVSVVASVFPGETLTAADLATLAANVQGSDGASLADVGSVSTIDPSTPTGDDQGTLVDYAEVYAYPLVWVFTPPVDGTHIHRQQHYPTNQVMKRTPGSPRHITLMVYGTQVILARKPTTAMLQGADFVYEGPANYPISDEERAILEAAGYGEPWLRQDSLPV
jgi:hypothetical protein